jgi:hypothetical protein
VEQELLTLPEHLRSPQVFSGVRVARSLVLYVCFVDRCLSFCTFSFGHLKKRNIFSIVGHLGYRTGLTDTHLKGDHPRIISAKFGLDWLESAQI